MKTFIIIVMSICCISAITSAQDTEGVDFGITVSNANGSSQYLIIGAADGATPGIDQTRGEAELPPTPPNEIFDARVASTPGKSDLGLGTLKDYRGIASISAPFTETYTISYQGGINTTSVKIVWNMPYPSRVTKVVADGQDLSGKTEINTNGATGLVTMLVTYNFAPLAFSANPTSLSFAANNRDPLPVKTFEVIPLGDTGAGWDVTSDADWLDLNPSSGQGRQTVEAGINTQVLPAGTYNATIMVRSITDPAKFDIPVTLLMTVGVKNPALPSDVSLHQNYPNPFTPATFIGVDLGNQIIKADLLTLKVYDIYGREISDLTSKIGRQPGMQQIEFHAGNLPAGMYVYRLNYNGAVQSRTMILTK